MRCSARWYLNIGIFQLSRADYLRLLPNSPLCLMRMTSLGFLFTMWTFFAGVAALLFYQRLFYPYFWTDWMYYLKVRKVGKETMAKMKRGVLTYLDRFVDQAKQSPEKPFIVFEEEVLTYMDVHLRSNKFANVFRSEVGVKHGDIVALWMSNEPDFVCAWFGLSKLGCEVAFLNTNIKAKSLQHCLQSCGAKALIVGSGTITLNVFRCGPSLVVSQINPPKITPYS